MPKLNAFQIVLNNPTSVYFGGQMIDGYVIVELNEPMKMRGIRLKINGAARVHWTERHTTGSGKHRRTTTRQYNASESYLDVCLVLYGKPPGQGGDNPVHDPGKFQYSFQCQLPYGIPSSFEGAYGRVRYELTAVIDKPWKFDHTTKMAFTAINLLDLNQEPVALTKPEGEKSKTLCCLCCASGPIRAVCRLDRAGYVPGENVLINAEINNNSSRTMDSSYVDLHQQVRFHATSKTRSVTHKVHGVRHGPINPGDSDYWNAEKMHIPPLPPSRLDGCRIIDINYVVMVVVDPRGPAISLKVPLNIIIGSIPLTMVTQEFRRQYSNIAEVQPIPWPVSHPAAVGPAAILPPPNGEALPSAPPLPALPADCPPPSYAECVFGKVNIRDNDDGDHTRGNLEFAPVYTYYNWDTGINQYATVNREEESG